MKRHLYLAVVSLASLFAFASCSSDDSTDTQKPEIDLVAPKDGTKVEAGKDIHFDMIVSDNEGLRSYNVDIHNDFDGHTHGDTHSHGIKAAVVETKPFIFNKTWDLNGVKNDKIHHHEIVVAENATPGKYHFVVKVLDVSGNQSMVVRSIEVVPQGEGDHDHDHEGDHDHDHAH